MNNTDIIYQTKPKLSIPGIVISILIALVIVYISDSLTVKLFMGGIFLLMFVLIILRVYFANGIVIRNSYIELIKKNHIGKVSKEKIQFEEIKKIGWSDGRVKWDSRAIYLDMKRKEKIKVLIDKGPFQFGHVLRFLSEKGIDIELFHSDHELRLFIDGKIKEFPMSNKKTA